MKIVIASDIHGSEFFCKKLMDAIEREQADRVLLLGDLLYHGPRNDLPYGHGPKSVILMLNSIADKILCVRGNCEAEVDGMVLDFSVEADYALLELNGLTLFASHGHHYNPQNPPKQASPYVLLNGHTHIPACEEHLGFTYINPGSVSIPKNGSQNSYILLDGTEFFWKNLDGEVYMTKKL